jgi:two-component system OmpR family response regulator
MHGLSAAADQHDFGGDAPGAQILFYDPDDKARDGATRYLDEAGFAVRTAFRSNDLDGALRAKSADLVVMHAGDKVEPSLDYCRRFGELRGPRLIVAGGFDDTDRILALELGADDYLAAPYHPRELLARVRAVLRPRRPRAESPAAVSRTFLGLKFDPTTATIRLAGGSPVSLTPGESSLLNVFVNRPGRVLNREELLDQARGDSDVFDRVIDVQISRLRRKLAQLTPDQIIRTYKNYGYQFVPTVR